MTVNLSLLENGSMGLTYADLELINGGDIELARRDYIDQDEIKRMQITALIDTGYYMLAIIESIQEQL